MFPYRFIEAAVCGGPPSVGSHTSHTTMTSDGTCLPRTACGRKDCCRLNGADDSPPSHRFPAFEFKPYLPGTEIIFPPALSNHLPLPLSFGNKRRIWVRPTTLDQLLRIKQALPQAKLVGGSSEVQVEIKLKAAPYDVCVYVADLPELLNVELPTAGRRSLIVGANVPLSELEKVCQMLYAELGPEMAGSLEAIRYQLRYFAGRQIRNVASAAGNIVTASPISDLNPVLVATDATVFASSLAAGEMQFSMSDFFTGYRLTKLPPDSVITRLSIPVNSSGQREVVRAYKQAKRKDDDIAIVNGCFRVRLDYEGVVSHASLVFGGMA
jgi:xanthine dehydrogenase/oxidase